MAPICCHWNQWQSSRDPHCEQVLASPGHLWEFQPSGQSVLDISEVPCSVALKTSARGTHTEHQPRVPSLCSLSACPHYSHFPFCSCLKSLLLPKSLFLPQLISYLLDFFFSICFDCTLQQPEFYHKVEPGSFFFLLFLFFFIYALFPNWYSTSQYRKRCIYVEFTPSFVSLSETRLNTNPQSPPKLLFLSRLITHSLSFSQ